MKQRREELPSEAKPNRGGASLSAFLLFVITSTSTSTTTAIPTTSTVASLFAWDYKAIFSLQRRPSPSSPPPAIYGLSPQRYLIPSPKTYIRPIPRLLERTSVSLPWISSNPPSHLRSPKAAHFLILSETESMSPIQSGPSIMLQNGYSLPLPLFVVTTGWKQVLIDAISYT